MLIIVAANITKSSPRHCNCIPAEPELLGREATVEGGPSAEAVDAAGELDVVVLKGNPAWSRAGRLRFP